MIRNRQLKRWLQIFAVVLCVSSAGGSVQQAVACPMCKAINEENDPRPRAYMYSILFMLAVPGTMVGGMAAGLVALSRRETASLAENGLSDDGVSAAGGEDVVRTGGEEPLV